MHGRRDTVWRSGKGFPQFLERTEAAFRVLATICSPLIAQCYLIWLSPWYLTRQGGYSWGKTLLSTTMHVISCQKLLGTDCMRLAWVTVCSPWKSSELEREEWFPEVGAGSWDIRHVSGSRRCLRSISLSSSWVINHTKLVHWWKMQSFKALLFWSRVCKKFLEESK